MLRFLAALGLALLLAPGSASSRTIVDAGVVAVGAEISSTERCTLGLDQELCVASWDTNNTLAPGDDDFVVDKSVDEVFVEVRPPLLDERRSVGVEPREVVVRHPVFTMLNETWRDLNQTLPAPVKEYVTLQSREMTMRPGVWGIWIVVDSPVEQELILLNYTLGDIYIGVLCWNLACYLVSNEGGYLQSDEHAIRPADDNFVLYRWDTDAYLEASNGWLECPWYVSNATCAPLQALRERHASAIPLVEEFAPRFTIGVQVNRTVVHIKPTQGPPAGAHGERGSDLQAAVASLVPAASQPYALIRSGLVEPIPLRESEEGRSAPVPDESRAEGFLAPRERDVAARSVSAIAWLLPGLGLVAGWLLYHRITRARALEQATRRRVFEAIAAEPGVRVGRIAARLGLNHNTVKHHVRLLEGMGLVKAVGDGQRHLFVVGKLSSQEERAHADALTNPATRAVLDFLQRHGPHDVSRLSCAMGLAPSTVSVSAARLERVGLVERRRVAGRVVVEAARPARPAGACEGASLPLVPRAPHGPVP